MTSKKRLQLLEEFVQNLNGNVFLREFSLSGSKLRVSEGEIEVADNLVFLRELSLIYQLKERHVTENESDSRLTAWFNRNVSGHAVKQIADTYEHLRMHEGRLVDNDQGHSVPLPRNDPSATCAIAIYRIPGTPTFRGKRGRTASRAGFVHFIEGEDYFRICKVLKTPTEIHEYLGDRKRLILDFPDVSVPERAMVGQFLIDASGPPREEYGDAFDHIVDSADDHDLSAVLRNFGERVDFRTGDASERSHYHILQELALLSRVGISALKARLKRCVEVVKAGEFENPFHFANPATDCAFLVAAWDTDLGVSREQYLETVARLSKYSFGVQRHVGLAVSDDPQGFYVFWSFLDEPHVADAAMDVALAQEGCPIRVTRERSVPRYHFETEGLERLLPADDL